MIKEKTRGQTFEFSHIDPSLVLHKINKLNSAKKTSGPVPVDKLKLVAESCYKEISYHINNAIDETIFPDNLKKADVLPIFKIGAPTSKRISDLSVSCQRSQKSLKG